MTASLESLHQELMQALDPGALVLMRLTPLASADIGQELARLRRARTLDILPFASDRAGWVLGFQLTPDRAWELSRVIAIDGEGRLLVASSAARLPSALVAWLWPIFPAARRGDLLAGSARLLTNMPGRRGGGSRRCARSTTDKSSPALRSNP